MARKENGAAKLAILTLGINGRPIKDWSIAISAAPRLSRFSIYSTVDNRHFWILDLVPRTSGKPSMAGF
jgi:hypothetical protein